MKKEYKRPSMAMNLFESTDNTNITVLSTVAQTRGEVTANKYGMSILDFNKLNN